jgi:redox-sensing transcriptional repressor
MPGAPTAARPLPEATLRRLPLYLRALVEASGERVLMLSSEELAARAGVNAAQVRKDLSQLGSYGTRGVGYDTELLRQQINRQLGLNREHNVAVIGAGNLGQALGNYRGFSERGFNVVAAFDTDPDKFGSSLGTAVVYPLSDLARVVREKKITMALITTPAQVAQDIADRLVAAGVSSVLNFAPAVLNVAPHVSVRKVDLAVELQILGYYEHLRGDHPAGPKAAGSATAAGAATATAGAATATTGAATATTGAATATTGAATATTGAAPATTGAAPATAATA